MAKFLIDENMGNKLSDSLDLYNNIKDINIQETTKVKSSSSFNTYFRTKYRKKFRNISIYKIY
jgi:hypothetical protein